MQTVYQSAFILKALGFWAVFMVLYFAYKYFPNRIFAIFCGTRESNFQHYKAAFYSWIFLNIIEYAAQHKQIADSEIYLYSRMGAATLLPWIIFILWYIVPAFYGKLPSVPLEVVYANVITIAAGVFGAILERGLMQIQYFTELKAVFWILFLLSISQYAIFTFVKLPWADVFVEPDWK